MSVAVQTTFAELGTPLFDVTFVVVDLETTGLSPASDRITEIGAVKCQRGETTGELHTLVHPGRPIPPAVTAVTGITDATVAGCPPIETVLPTFLEFARGSVLVAHNAPFDMGFLNAALERHGQPRLDHVVIDTARLARRLLRDEVRDTRLATLARHLRSRTAPEHRALLDARATVDVLHGLFERAGSLGATTLEDLRDLSRSTSEKAYRKIGLADGAPDAPGVYRFLDQHGEVLYVGKATNLRTRLRQYFGQDTRKKVAHLVRDAAEVRWEVTATPLEANIREIRAIHAHRPRYNRRSKHPEKAVWVRLTRERFPRLSIVTSPPEDGSFALGPLPSRGAAERFIEAVQDALPIRRCTFRIRVAQDHAPCSLKELGRCGAPCDGTQSPTDYQAVVERLRGAATGDPGPLVEPLRDRMWRHAEAGRYEQAADHRSRLHDLVSVLFAVRRRAAPLDVPLLVAARPDGEGWKAIAVRWGRLDTTTTVSRFEDAADWAAQHARRPVLPPGEGVQAMPIQGADPAAPPPLPSREEAEEIGLVGAWLDEPDVVALHVDGDFASSVPGGAALDRLVSESRSVARQVRRDRQQLRGDKVRRRSSDAA